MEDLIKKLQELIAQLKEEKKDIKSTWGDVTQRLNYIKSEAFIDEIIDRIKRKQLNI